jgi:hypothetical protein
LMVIILMELGILSALCYLKFIKKPKSSEAWDECLISNHDFIFVSTSRDLLNACFQQVCEGK